MLGSEDGKVESTLCGAASGGEYAVSNGILVGTFRVVETDTSVPPCCDRDKGEKPRPEWLNRVDERT